MAKKTPAEREESYREVVRFQVRQLVYGVVPKQEPWTAFEGALDALIAEVRRNLPDADQPYEWELRDAEAQRALRELKHG